MSNYATIITEAMVLVVDTLNGEDVKFFKDDANFDQAVKFIKEGRPQKVFDLDVKTVVSKFFTFGSADKSVSVRIENGVGKIILHDFSDMEAPLSDAIIKKITTMASQGFDCKPMVNFLSNLYRNPSETAIAELYLFIEACNLPITEDGHFIAYKIVRNDYMDIYTGKMDNSVGKVLEMPRGLVDADRQNTCSRGLHFCSKEYLNAYGSSRRDADRCMLVKINPADVVAIPSDYNNAKGRTWKYEVVSEVEAGWRATLPQKDYTDSAVVDKRGAVIASPAVSAWVAPAPAVQKKLLSFDQIADLVDGSDFYYSVSNEQWYEAGDEVGRKHVKTNLGVEYEDLDTYQEGIDW